MTLRERIAKLMDELAAGIPEREYCIQLSFLTMIIGEPFYIYGRSGSGKAIVLDRLIAAFKNAKSLKIGRRQQEVPTKLSDYDIVVFLSYDPSNENMKNWVQIALQDRGRTPLIVSGDVRPEEALTRGDIIDKLALTVHSRRHHTAAGAAFNARLFHFFLRLQHFCLHFIGNQNAKLQCRFLIILEGAVDKNTVFIFIQTFVLIFIFTNCIYGF